MREETDQHLNEAKSIQGPHWIWLSVLACVSAWLYAEIRRLSHFFRYESPPQDRPIVAVMVLFGIAFVVYLAAFAVVRRAPESRRLLGLVFAGAVVFRLLLVGSVPIQEVDIYRYIWDGEVVAAGANPFQYSPQQVIDAASATENAPILLQKLSSLREQSESLNQALSRVHYGILPTIYPPTSQLVFGFVGWLTPGDVTLDTRLTIMKLAFCLFDLGTLWLVSRLLVEMGKPATWAILYGWCPLLMKEVANSGHLDAIAVFLMTLSVYTFVRAFRERPSAPTSVPNTAMLFTSATVLALAFAAKLFPIILTPLFAVFVWRRVSARKTVESALLFTLVATLLMWPMIGQRLVASEPPAPGTVQSTDGLEKFLKTWEMNDFVFLLLIENLKPDAFVSPEYRAWFTVVPDGIRTGITDSVATSFGIEPAETPFAIARGVTLLTFLFVMAWLCWCCWSNPSLDVWLESAFLTLAWFWLLCPTQNPWYWSWTLPLVVFARQRTWLLMSGLCLLYYLRFWLIYQWPEAAVLGTGYAGTAFFDLIVTWVEYFPWYVLLASECWRQRKRSTQQA